jgi:hypothetical protein
VRGVAGGEVIPWGVVDDLPEDGIEYEALVDRRPAAGSLEREVGSENRIDERPLLSGEMEGMGGLRKSKHGRGIFE